MDRKIPSLSITAQLRKIRRPVKVAALVPKPEVKVVYPKEEFIMKIENAEKTVLDSKQSESDSKIPSGQTIIKPDRLSVEDQLLLQKSLIKSANSKFSEELGIVATNSEEIGSCTEEEEDSEQAKKKKRAKERKTNINRNLVITEQNQTIPAAAAPSVINHKSIYISDLSEKNQKKEATSKEKTEQLRKIRKPVKVATLVPKPETKVALPNEEIIIIIEDAEETQLNTKQFESDSKITEQNSIIPAAVPPVVNRKNTSVSNLSEKNHQKEEATFKEKTEQLRKKRRSVKVTSLVPKPKTKRALPKEEIIIIIEDAEETQLNTKQFESDSKIPSGLTIVPTSNEEDGSCTEEDLLKTNKKREGEQSSNSNGTLDTFSALIGSNRKRKRAPVGENPEPIILKPKLSRVETKLVSVLEEPSLKFYRLMEHILTLDMNEVAEDGMIAEEYLLSRIVMQELCIEAAKLKMLGVMEQMPIDKLVRLLNVLELNIRAGDQVSPITDEGIWLERVMRAVDACLVCLNIMTSANMPKLVYLEEVIDRVVLYIKYHLHNTIFPSFASTYQLDNKKKEHREKKATPLLVLYTKMSELVNLLAELLNIQVLTDTLVLQASSIGVSPLFIENVNELQLACLKLVTAIFTRYETHRKLLLDDILASIAGLSSTKRSLRTYRLNSEEHIQILTALVLQLIQSIVVLPDNLLLSETFQNRAQNKNVKVVDKDVLICNKYEKALSTAQTFLCDFLNKCHCDHRTLFENVVQDLLSTFNKPEWPAAEMLLSLLGRMLVCTFSNKATDMSLRVASLEYLGIVAVRLRRDSTRCTLDRIGQMMRDMKMKNQPESERTQFLQRVLLDFLAVKAQNDEAYKHARHFYIAQWYKDAICEKPSLASETKSKKQVKKNHKRDGSDTASGSKRKQQNTIVDKKTFLLQNILVTNSPINCVQIDYDSAELIAQYFASKRYFSQSFDLYLKAILIMLKETSIAIRTKAVKCLTMIVEADPSVLGQDDMQVSVNQSFLDHSSSVREAAVDLVGKFVLSHPGLIDKYYGMLSGRILDTSVGVRKRVIKIFKDICIECPEFERIPDICVKMICRVNDEEGIQKLVMEVFENMWLTPTKDTSLLRKIMNITDVVAASKDIGLECFEQLLLSLFKPKEDQNDSSIEPPKALLLACHQIVDCLMENVLQLERSGSSQRLVAYFTTLSLFAKVRPQLLVKHVSILQPYLASKCQPAIISNVAQMLEFVVPLMEHPSDSFLAHLQGDAMKLVLQQERPIVTSCLSCLSAIINKVTRNYQLIRDCFKRYHEYLLHYKLWLETENEEFTNLAKTRQYFRRALFTIGLLLRFFDFRNLDVIGDLPLDIKDQIYQLMMSFLQRDDFDIQANTLQAIGCICIRHSEFMLKEELKSFYYKLLTDDKAPLKLKIEVLINVERYLIEEENRMIQKDLEWVKQSKKENLKEMGDVNSGMASTVIQLYLKEILQLYLHNDVYVRQAASKVIGLVLQQGLVHPVQIVPYLISMSTDHEKMVSHTADKQLLDIEKKYPGLIYTKSSLGMKLSYKLQTILHGDGIVRGFCVREYGEYPSSLNGYLYSMLRNSRQQRRALILNILKQFDEQVRTSLSYMLYLADNLAYFSYMVQDEPLFIVHQIDLIISVSGTNLLQSFREGLVMTEAQQIANVVSALDEENDDEDALASRVPEDTRQLQAYLTTAQGCLLLLMLKQHLKDIYGISDNKIQQYSPSEAARVYDKNVPRRSSGLFNPKGTIQKLEEGNLSECLDENGRRDLIRQYLDFKQLMLKLDRNDPYDKVVSAPSSDAVGSSQSLSILRESDQREVPKQVTLSRRIASATKSTPRTSKKLTNHRHKQKGRKIVSTDDESGRDCSDPDFVP